MPHGIDGGYREQRALPAWTRLQSSRDVECGDDANARSQRRHERALNVWLLKTEPAECSIEDIRDARGGSMRWDGIRNYQARNFLRDAVRSGDHCLIYHSGIREPAVVGCAEVVRAGYPDPAQFQAATPLFDAAARPDAPRWYCIDIRYREHFVRPVSIGVIRSEAGLQAMLLLKQGRLSVQPVTAREYAIIRRLARGKGP